LLPRGDPIREISHLTSWRSHSIEAQATEFERVESAIRVAI